MSSLVRIMLILLVVILVGGTIALATWNIPAPSAKVEKVIPDERFQR